MKITSESNELILCEVMIEKRTIIIFITAEYSPVEILRQVNG